MALRIGPQGGLPMVPGGPRPPSPMGGPPPAPPMPPGLGAGGPAPEEPDNDDKSSRFDVEKVPQPISGYMGPENGPFECEHCVHFEEPNACGLVQGDIDPHGCCNLFQPDANRRPGPGGDNDADDEEEGEQSVVPPTPSGE